MEKRPLAVTERTRLVHVTLVYHFLLEYFFCSKNYFLLDFSFVRADGAGSDVIAWVPTLKDCESITM